MAESSAGLRKRDENSPNFTNKNTKSETQNVPNNSPTFGAPGAGIWGGSAQPNLFEMPRNSENVNPPNCPPSFRTAGEYTQAVRGWIWQYYMWNSMNNFYTCSFPFYCMGFTQASALAASSPAPGVSQRFGANQFRGGQGTPAGQNIPPRQQQGRPQEQQNLGQDYRIPPIWKRVAAEFIDFLLLLLIKVGVTCILVDYTGTISRIPKYNFPLFQDFDPLTSLEELYLMLVWALLFRVTVCGYEALCLRHGIRTVGGSTPGKRVMGLCVVSCTEAIELPDNKVRVIPAQNIGFWNALVRSVIKNFSLAFLFPMCFTALFFQHGRAAYDIISNCIVVESNDDLFLGRQR